MHRLYMLMNYIFDIFLLRLSSNSQIILSISVFVIFISTFFNTSLISFSVKYFPLLGSERESKTRMRYFYSVGLMLNSWSFSSMVFSFCTFLLWSLMASKSICLDWWLGCLSNTIEFLYFCCRCMGRSLYCIFFFYYLCISL